MQYDSITLDTNIFRHNGFYLEGGMLGQFVQFREGFAQFVLSEIVVREVHKYLKIEAKEATDDLGKAIKKSSKSGLLLEESIRQLTAIHEGALPPKDASEGRLKAFLESTGAEIVPADQTEIKELIQRYFTPAAPFEASGKKRTNSPMPSLSSRWRIGRKRTTRKSWLSLTTADGRISPRILSGLTSRRTWPLLLKNYSSIRRRQSFLWVQC